MPDQRIKRALISVCDKTGIVDFARALTDEFGIEILSTGGTAALLKKEGVRVTLVEEVTDFPEMMDGRVKTLHPKIHAAILADRDNPEHMRQLKEQGIEPIDMVVVNLYPFQETIKKPDCTFAQAIEMIDIGGPCLLRAAAKNHRHVLVITDSLACNDCLAKLRQNAVSDEMRLRAASNAFRATCRYDARITEWMRTDEAPGFSGVKFLELCGLWRLRYGENPHQRGGLYGPTGRPPGEPRPAEAHDPHGAGEGMSFNNYVDASAALELCKELTRTLAVKHVGPAFQPVSPRLDAERHTERHLPHIEHPGAHYLVTFRLRTGTLAPEERDIVLQACRHWHGKKMTLHACVVMPDHVHLLITPHEVEPGRWTALGEILQSVKGYSAREINKKRKSRGALWLDESWDRVVRNEQEYAQRWEYIENNPERAGLEGAYQWVWLNHHAWEDLAESDRLESRSHILRVGPAFQPVNMHPAGLDRAGCNRAVVFIKHTNACGTGVADDPLEAYRKAYLGDPNAAMGGILACNFDVDGAFAQGVMETYTRWGKDAGAGGFFLEVWIAPFFDSEAREVIKTSKKWGERVRILTVGDMTAAPNDEDLDYKKITGGMLVQQRDLIGLNEEQWKVVTNRKPTDQEMADLRLAWLICKHTKSNAITLCKDRMLIGNGAGQMSRVMSCRIATWLAKENGHSERLRGAAAASDAFFPFRDGPDMLLDAGVTAIIQPGGSKRDDDTIAACNERDVAMIFTGTRHFRH